MDSLMVSEPLADVRVLRIGDRLAGRTLTRLLTDQGARATVVGLDDPDARAKAIAACAGCDIVVEAGATGRADAAGLGFDDLASVRPGLIYCSLPVFPTGPATVPPGAEPAGTGGAIGGGANAGGANAGGANAGRAGAGGVPVDDDIAIAAELGLNFVAGREPRGEELPVGSSFGAFLAAGYVMAALLTARRHPSGQRIVVPLAAATLTTVARRLIRAADPALVDPVAGPRLPIASRYECSDGRFVQSGGAYSRFVETFVDVIGRPEWRPEAVQALLGLPTAADEAAWRARLAAVFLERTADEWERAINDAGGSCTRCRTRAEWLAEPHAREAGIVVNDGTSIRAGRAVRVFEAAPGGGSSGLWGDGVAVPGGGPEGGSSGSWGDGVAVPGGGPEGGSSGSWGDGVAAAPDGGGPGDSDPPLRGVVVVDLSIVLAGPTCGRALGDLGADVIKVDDPHRPISPYGWLEVNRGKRSILLDLRRDEGREVLWRMLSGADVLLENYRHGKLDRLGFGFADVAKACPGIVYASLNAFDVGGPWAARPGWEHNAQAATGMQLALGGWGPGRPPDQVPYPLNDFGTGLLGAYGILLALRRRDATGAAQFVAGSLARTATFISSPLFEGQPADRAASTVRWLPCPDGFVGVVQSVPDGGASGGGASGGDASGGDASDGDGSDGDPIREAAVIAGRAASREEAAERLRAAGFGCVVVRGPAELPDRPWARDSGLTVEWGHPRWGALRQARARGWATSFEPSPGYPAHDPGQDTSALLTEHGYDDRDIRRLVESGAVASVPLFDMWSVA